MGSPFLIDQMFQNYMKWGKKEAVVSDSGVVISFFQAFLWKYLNSSVWCDFHLCQAAERYGKERQWWHVVAGRWFPVSERSCHGDKPQSHPGLSVFVDTESLSTGEICSLLILNPWQQAVITESCRAPRLLAVGTQWWNEEVRMCCWRVASLVLWCSSSRRTSGGVEESHRHAWSRLGLWYFIGRKLMEMGSCGGKVCVCVCRFAQPEKLLTPYS